MLGALTLRAAAPTRAPRRIVLTVFVLTSLFGATDEWHQQFVAGRSQDLADWLADTLGAGTGVLAAVAVRSRREPVV